jgi:hypothetical protein
MLLSLHHDYFQGVAMDTGRISMEDYRGILYCEAYMSDEFSSSDLESMRAKIRADYAPSTDVILKKSGSYSVALDAQLILQKGVKEFRNFVYVVNDNKKKDSAEYAAASYMQRYNTRVASTKEEAYAMLIGIL